MAAASLLLGLGAVALLIQGGSARRDRRGAGGRRAGHRAVVLSRAQGEPEAAVPSPGWVRRTAPSRACSSPPRASCSALPVAPARAPVPCSRGWSALVGLGEGRTLVIPPVVVGALVPGDRAVHGAAVVRPRGGAHHRAGPDRDRRQRVPVARPRGDRHQGRPALHASPTSPPTPTRSTRHEVGADARDRPRDPGGRVRHGRAAAGADRAARRRAWGCSARWSP